MVLAVVTIFIGNTAKKKEGKSLWRVFFVSKTMTQTISIEDNFRIKLLLVTYFKSLINQIKL